MNVDPEDGRFTILVAVNAFKGSLSSIVATHSLASGFAEGFPGAEIVECPLADGGDGTLEVMCAAFSGAAETEEIEVCGPLGTKVKASVLFLPDGTAVIESATACGLALVPDDKRDPWKTTSYGVGQLIRHAIERGAKTILVGVGGTATNDGGIGMAQALGALVLDERGDPVAPGIRGLFQVSKILPAGLPVLLKQVKVIGACDVSNPLVGPDGATATYGPQKGLRAEEVLAVDRAMLRYGEVVERDLGVRVLGIPRTGAGGGIGAALRAFLGAELLDGAHLIMERTGVLGALEDADVVITGEGCMDSQTQKGKAPYALAQEAHARGKPVIAVSGSLAPELMDAVPQDFSAAFSTCPGPVSLEEAMRNSETWLRFLGGQLGSVLRIGFLARAGAQGRLGDEFEERCFGGIMLRRSPESKTEVLLIKDRFGVYAPPKGHLEPGEEPAAGALREVFEETGVPGRVMGEVGETVYAYIDSRGAPVRKKVTYFLLVPDSSSSPSPQAGETLEAAWVTEDRIFALPFYPNNGDIVRRAIRMFEDLPPKSSCPR